MRKTRILILVLLIVFSLTATASLRIGEHTGTSLSGIKIGTSAVNSRVRQYDYLFKQAGDQYGVDPNILAAICMQESSGINYSYRPDGTSYPAWGIMQIEYVLIPDFAKFGLETTGTAWTSEDRLVPEKAIMYAANLISQSLMHYDLDYAKTIQSYNFGMTVTDRIISAAGDGWMAERVNAKYYADNWKYDSYGDAKYVENVLRYYHTSIPYIGAKVRIDGKLIGFQNQYPILLNKRAMVPLRGVSEYLGASVSWNDSTQTVTVKKNNVTVTLKIGSNTAYINQREYILDNEPILLNKRTLVPIRFLAEALNFNVSWDDSSRTVYVY